MIEWTAQWYRDPATGLMPAFEFLAAVPVAVREQLLAIREAVRFSGGPHRWRDTSSHALMHGELDFMYEARDRHGATLYRLFMVWDRATGEVVMVDGRTKPNGTALPRSEYSELARIGRRIMEAEPRPYATLDDFASTALRMSAERDPS